MAFRDLLNASDLLASEDGVIERDASTRRTRGAFAARRLSMSAFE
jgi:hypothetical protein